jgi:hypothetical protein
MGKSLKRRLQSLWIWAQCESAGELSNPLHVLPLSRTCLTLFQISFEQSRIYPLVPPEHFRPFRGDMYSLHYVTTGQVTERITDTRTGIHTDSANGHFDADARKRPRHSLANSDERRKGVCCK